MYQNPVFRNYNSKYVNFNIDELTTNNLVEFIENVYTWPFTGELSIYVHMNEHDKDYLICRHHQISRHNGDYYDEKEFRIKIEDMNDHDKNLINERIKEKFIDNITGQ